MRTQKVTTQDSLDILMIINTLHMFRII